MLGVDDSDLTITTIYINSKCKGATFCFRNSIKSVVYLYDINKNSISYIGTVGNASVVRHKQNSGEHSLGLMVSDKDVKSMLGSSDYTYIVDFIKKYSYIDNFMGINFFYVLQADCLFKEF